MTYTDYFEIIVGEGGHQIEELREMKYAWEVEHVIKGIFRRYRTQWETMIVLARVTRNCVSSQIPDYYPFTSPLPWMDNEKKMSDEEQMAAMEAAMPELEKLVM